MVRLIAIALSESNERLTCFNSKDGAIDSRVKQVVDLWDLDSFNSKDGAIDSWDSGSEGGDGIYVSIPKMVRLIAPKPALLLLWAL